MEEIPENPVPDALSDLSRHLRIVGPRTWPPAWFGSIEGDGRSVAARSEELFGDDFGR